MNFYLTFLFWTIQFSVLLVLFVVHHLIFLFLEIVYTIYLLFYIQVNWNLIINRRLLPLHLIQLIMPFLVAFIELTRSNQLLVTMAMAIWPKNVFSLSTLHRSNIMRHHNMLSSLIRPSKFVLFLSFGSPFVIILRIQKSVRLTLKVIGIGI